MLKQLVSICIVLLCALTLFSCGPAQPSPGVSPDTTTDSAKRSTPSFASTPIESPSEYVELAVETQPQVFHAEFIPAIPLFPEWTSINNIADIYPLELSNNQTLGSTTDDGYVLLKNDTDHFLFDKAQNRITKLNHATSIAFSQNSEGLCALQKGNEVFLYDQTMQPLNLSLIFEPSKLLLETAKLAHSTGELPQTQTYQLVTVQKWNDFYILSLFAADTHEMNLLYYREDGELFDTLHISLNDSVADDRFFAELSGNTLFITKQSDKNVLVSVDLDRMKATFPSCSDTLFFADRLAVLWMDSANRAAHLSIYENGTVINQIDITPEQYFPFSKGDSLEYDAGKNTILLIQTLQIIEFNLENNTASAMTNMQSTLQTSPDGLYSIYLTDFEEETAYLWLRNNHIGKLQFVDTFLKSSHSSNYTFTLFDHSIYSAQTNTLYDMDASTKTEHFLTDFYDTALNSIYDSEQDTLILATLSPSSVRSFHTVVFQFFDLDGVKTKTIETNYTLDDLLYDSFSFGLAGNSIVWVTIPTSTELGQTAQTVLVDLISNEELLRCEQDQQIWRSEDYIFFLSSHTAGSATLSCYAINEIGLIKLFALQLNDTTQNLLQYNFLDATYNLAEHRLKIPPIVKEWLPTDEKPIIVSI